MNSSDNFSPLSLSWLCFCVKSAFPHCVRPLYRHFIPGFFGNLGGLPRVTADDALLLYGYYIGITSSRKIEDATYDNLAFRYLSADQHPCHDTLAASREEYLEALAGLFGQALRLCQKAGLVKLGNIAIDGYRGIDLSPVF